MEGVTDLRGLWQLPATWHALSHLSTVYTFTQPTPTELENYLTEPQQHLQAIAILHARLQGISVGQAGNKWLSATARAIRNFPHSFAQVFPLRDEMLVEGDDDIVSDAVDLDAFEPTEEGYMSHPAKIRLLLLHALAEHTISRSDPPPLRELPPDITRLNPIGYDSKGNAYWYFNDDERVYREPSAKRIEASRRAAQARAKKEEKEAKKREREQKKEEVQRKKAERRKRDAERWAPRAAATRVTRASRRLSNAGAEPKAKSSRGKRESESANAPTPKRPRRTMGSDQELDEDPVRVCENWELVAHGSDGVRELIAKFGDDDVRVGEKALVRVLNELAETFEEHETRLRRQRERKARTVFMQTNQKRSSRVQAIAAKKEEEARRVAQEEERDRIEEEKLAMHAERVAEEAREIERMQSVEIREVRKAHGVVGAIERDLEAVKKVERARPHRGGVVRRSLRSRRGFKIADGEASAAEGGQDAGSEGDAQHDGDVEIPAEVSENADVENGPDVPKEGKKDDEEASKDQFFSTAAPEDSVSDSFTWDLNEDDKLPIRVLDKFFFAHRKNFMDAPLEASDEPTSAIVGCGILIPPPKSSATAMRVEISHVREWQIEYGQEPKLWVVSEGIYYELRDPAVEYQDVFKSARRKFELCIRVAILGESMRGPQLNYGSIVDYLSMTYGNMGAYLEKDILDEKRFIVAQIESLNRRSLMQSGFIKGLQKRIRAEEREQVPDEYMYVRKPDDIVEVKPTDLKVEAVASSAGDEISKGASSDGGGVLEKEISKKPPRRRSVNGKKPVPRVVSTIINGLIKTATKSYKPPRKKKRDSDADGTSNSKAVPMLDGHVSVNETAPPNGLTDHETWLSGNGSNGQSSARGDAGYIKEAATRSTVSKVATPLALLAPQTDPDLQPSAALTQNYHSPNRADANGDVRMVQPAANGHVGMPYPYHGSMGNGFVPILPRPNGVNAVPGGATMEVDSGVIRKVGGNGLVGVEGSSPAGKGRAAGNTEK